MKIPLRRMPGARPKNPLARNVEEGEEGRAEQERTSLARNHSYTRHCNIFKRFERTASDLVEQVLSQFLSAGAQTEK